MASVLEVVEFLVNWDVISFELAELCWARAAVSLTATWMSLIKLNNNAVFGTLESVLWTSSADEFTSHTTAEATLDNVSRLKEFVGLGWSAWVMLSPGGLTLGNGPIGTVGGLLLTTIDITTSRLLDEVGMLTFSTLERSSTEFTQVGAS